MRRASPGDYLSIVTGYGWRPRAGLLSIVGVLPIEGELRGRLYMRDRPHLPARNLDELRETLRVKQRRDLGRQLARVGQPEGLSFIVMVWSTPAGYNLLVLGLDRPENGRLTVTVYEPARTDTEILKLRAGRDAPGMADQTVVLFGAGAIGSHIADLLTRSGRVPTMLEKS